MSHTPSELKYASSHEWARLEDDGTITVGITDFVKAASDIYAPVAGEVIEVNESLEDEPERVNAEPYEDGWFYRLRPSDEAEIDMLLSAEDYQASCEAE